MGKLSTAEKQGVATLAPSASSAVVSAPTQSGAKTADNPFGVIAAPTPGEGSHVVGRQEPGGFRKYREIPAGVRAASKMNKRRRKRVLKDWSHGIDSSREKHTYQFIPGKGIRRSNFCGPGTDVMGRLRRGDLPVNDTDRTCMEHDIRFTLAAGIEDKKERLKMGRDADHIMLKKTKKGVGRAVKDFKKHPFKYGTWIEGASDAIHYGAIAAKTKAEDVGLLKRDKFIGEYKQISPEDRALLESNLTKLNDGTMKTFAGESQHKNPYIDTGAKIAGGVAIGVGALLGEPLAGMKANSIIRNLADIVQS